MRIQILGALRASLLVLALVACSEGDAPPADPGAAPGADPSGSANGPAGLQLPEDLPGSWQAMSQERDTISAKLAADDLDGARPHASRLAVYAGMLNLYTSDLPSLARDRVEKSVRALENIADLLASSPDLKTAQTHQRRLSRLMRVLQKTFPEGALSG